MFLVFDILILTLAVLRLTRLVMMDDLGKWYILGPAHRWAQRKKRLGKARSTSFQMEGQVGGSTETFTFHGESPIYQQHPDGTSLARLRLIGGLTCPFCIGWHIGFWLLLISYWTGPLGHEPVWWRILLGSLAMNWVVGHVASRVGDTDPNAPF